MKVTGKEDPDIAAVREMLHTLYAYTSDEANPPGEGRSWSHQQGRAALDRLASRLAETEARLEAAEAECGRLQKVIAAKNDLLTAYRIGSQPKANAALRKLEALAGKDAEMSDNTEKKPWADWPEAGPDDWEPCPKCGYLVGGCPFCGHGYIPKEGFKWPKPQRTGAA